MLAYIGILYEGSKKFKWRVFFNWFLCLASKGLTFSEQVFEEFGGRSVATKCNIINVQVMKEIYLPRTLFSKNRSTEYKFETNLAGICD